MSDDRRSGNLFINQGTWTDDEKCRALLICSNVAKDVDIEQKNRLKIKGSTCDWLRSLLRDDRYCDKRN